MSRKEGVETCKLLKFELIDSHLDSRWVIFSHWVMVASCRLVATEPNRRSSELQRPHNANASSSASLNVGK